MQCQCRCSKKYNVKHFMTVHKDYTNKSPDNSKICSNKDEDLKQILQSHQTTFSKPINKAKEANTTLYRITEILAKKKRFEDGDVINKCLSLASKSLFNILKIQLKYAMQIRRTIYLELLSLQEWNVCPVT